MKFIQLKCENCGGTLEVDEAKVYKGKKIVIFTSSETYTCKHCGATYTKDDELNIYTGGFGGGSIISSVVGGDIISGSGLTVIKTGGDYVVGNKNTVAKGNSLVVSGNLFGDIIL